MKLLFALIVLTALSGLEAATLSWWRFESDADGDNTNGAFENPNEVSGEPALISDNAVLGTSAPDLFAPFVPGPGVANTASVRSQTQGGTEGIFGTAAYSSTLDVESITVEFWVRTNESDAGFVARTTSPDTGEQGTISDGFRIVDPNSVRVDFWTSELKGNGDYSGGSKGPAQTTIDSGISINDGDWHFIAFRYNSVTGLANLVIDYNEFEATLAADRVMFWGGSAAGDLEPEVTMGYRLDGNSGNNNGTLDEVRFTDQYEEDTDLLNPIPEPSALWSGLGLCLFAVVSELRRRIKLAA